MPAIEKTVPKPPYDIVAIGASAGGITALKTIIEALPIAFAAALLVVQHLDPARPSQLAHVLGHHSRIPVRQAIEGLVIEPGIAYVAPPDLHLLARDGRIVLTRTDRVRFSRPSVDSLFTSVAESCGSRAIAVVLTGFGSDGAAGIRAIKAHGGRTIAQEPDEAAHASMPLAALATDCIDLRLPVGKIGPMLVAL